MKKQSRADRSLKEVEENALMRILRKIWSSGSTSSVAKAKTCLTNEDPATRDSFIASRGWCENFMRRHGRKTTTAQKDTSFLLDRLASYDMHVRRLQKQHSFALSDILAMNETPVWNDMVSNTTEEHGMFP